LVLIVVVGLALSIYASFRSAQNGEAQAWAEFERQATGDVDALKARINASFGAVAALAALYNARDSVEQGEFERLPKRSGLVILLFRPWSGPKWWPRGSVSGLSDD